MISWLVQSGSGILVRRSKKEKDGILKESNEKYQLPDPTTKKNWQLSRTTSRNNGLGLKVAHPEKSDEC